MPKARTHRFAIRLNDEELKRFRLISKQTGKPVSVILRDRILLPSRRDEIIEAATEVSEADHRDVSSAFRAFAEALLEGRHV
jgi:predicted DNA-binding protein